MTIHTDSYYSIGSSHKFCEDFAINSKVDSNHLVVVSDGCSGSLLKDGIRESINVDIGARLLSLFAVSQFKNVFNSTFTHKEIYELLALALPPSMVGLSHRLSIPYSAFDATLLLGFCDEYSGCNGVYVFGDGCVVFDGDKYTKIHTIEFETNAPFYLSYLMDINRTTRYHDEFGSGKKKIKTVLIPKDNNKETKTIENIVPYSAPVCFHLNEYSGEEGDVKYDKVTLMTDGINTFIDTVNRVNKDVVEMAQAVTGYKSLNGEFIKKCWNLVKRKCKKENLEYTDDLGMAGFIITQ
jgi:hypothetical protein